MKRKALLGRKIGMTRILNETGEVTPVTIVELGPCYVTQVKTESSDGYNAVQIGFEQVARLNSPEKGHLRNLPMLKHLREVAHRGLWTATAWARCWTLRCSTPENW